MSTIRTDQEAQSHQPSQPTLNNSENPGNISPSSLCASCETITWGPSAWKDFHERTSYFTHRKWQEDDPALVRFISYTAPVETFYAKSSSHTCAWCALLIANHDTPPTLEVAQDYSIQEYQVDLEFCAPQGREPLRINIIRVLITAMSGDRQLMRWRGTFSAVARPNMPASRDFFAPRVTTYTTQEFDHRRAKWWTEDCLKRHEGCNPVEKGKELLSTEEEAGRNGGVRRPPRPATNTPRLPTRVLQVLPNPKDTERAVVLLRESREGETGSYACLSYTWGAERRHDFAKLAQELFSSGLSDPRIALPAVFADAAQVVLKLGIEFLWIDALCIWQNDPEDKKRELSVMHHYYTEATVVVQTSGTTSVDESFLGETRNSPTAKMVRDACQADVSGNFIKVPYEWADQRAVNAGRRDGGEPQHGCSQSTGIIDTNMTLNGGEGSNCESGHRGDSQIKVYHDTLFICPAADLPYYNVELEPASARGWIFQEQNLCRRLLVFPSGGGMVFKCDAHLWGQHDGNINYFLPRQPLGAQLGLPPWGKKKLMYEGDYPESVKYIPFHDRLLELFDHMRRLAMLGKRPELTLEGGRVTLVVDLDEAQRTERDRMRKYWEKADTEREQSALGGSAEPIGDRENGKTSSDPNQRKTIWNLSGKISVDEDLGIDQSDTADSQGAITTYFQPFVLSQKAFYTDGTSITSKFPPVEHPYLMMGCLDLASPNYGKEVMIATGPMPGHIFPSQLMNAWNRLVSGYCRRELSYPRDKLVAMAALASKFEEWYGKEVLGQYHAGLWANYMEEGLLWENADLRSITRALYSGTDSHGQSNGHGEHRQSQAARQLAEPAGYDPRTPSWSWAAIRHARYYGPRVETETYANAFELDFRVLSIETSPAADSPPNGAVVDGGYLRISGLLMDVWWGIEPDKHGEKNILLYTTSMHGDDEGEGIGAFGSANADHERHCAGIRRIREKVTLMLGRRFIRGGKHEEDHIAECLLLKPKEDGHTDEFIRVGFAAPEMMDFEKRWRPCYRKADFTLY